MKTIGIYKFGNARYKDREDVNSGGFEKKLIEDKLNHLSIVVDLNEDTQFYLSSKPIKFDAIILIGGMLLAEDTDNWHDILYYLSVVNTSCKSIFVATDIDCITKLRDVINVCDYCLTQTDHKFADIIPPQLYSYVPELFYRSIPQFIKPLKQSRMTPYVFFAGSVDGREDKMRDYLFEDRKCRLSKPRTFSIVKTREFDNRIRYQDQIQLLSEHPYTLMIVTKECRSIGWITSRLFEALSTGTVPLFDYEYDTHCKYADINSVLRVYDYDSMIAKLDCTNEERIEILAAYASLQEKAAINRNKFIDLVFTLIG